ncbi:MAG TPA: hypothetical protein VEC93_10060, partial [Anaerolineae bacterium]|nr:hypothetical protein [Anaerolineae bacterium]
MLKLYRLGLAATIVLGLILGLSPTQTQAQWPPFDFQVTHTYENGKITYHLDFHTKVRWLMTNLAFKMPVPEGTRFVEANAPAATTSSFDGTEVTFLTASLLGLGRSVNSPEIDISDVSFTVEVVDPTKTVFTTRAWLAWEGDQPGNYLIEDIAVDTTQAPLNWAPPRPPRLQLETMARAADGVITYIVYPQNVGTRVRMQDVKINIPIPAGTTYLSAEASHPFVANFNGQEVNFSALELERRAKIGPLKVQVAAEGGTTPTVAMYAWATWKNAGGQVGQSIVAQEETRTADTIIQPQASEWVVSDLAGDVPLSNYDLTSIALKEEGTKLRVTFYMAGPLTSTGESLTYFLYIDSDCLRSTGKRIGGLGAEYRVRYKQHVNRANISAWDQSEKGWGRNHSIQANSVAGQNSFALWAPYNILQNDRQFCWVVEAENGTSALNPAPPLEKVPNGTNAALTQYEGVATASTTTTAPIEAAPVKKKPVSGVFIKPSDEWRYLPGWEEFPTDWQTLDFDDSDWLSGSASIGYGSGKYATNLSLIPAPVQTNEPLTITRQAVDQSGVVVAVLPSAHIGSFLMRRTFLVTNALALTKLNLEVQYQGGFVAYLNGAEIARRGLGETDTPVLYNTLAETENGRKTREVIDVSSYIP